MKRHNVVALSFTLRTSLFPSVYFPFLSLAPLVREQVATRPAPRKGELAEKDWIDVLFTVLQGIPSLIYSHVSSLSLFVMAYLL
jgi:hypothetical protein